MPARRGGFGASLQPFGGGVLNLDDAYKVEPLTPTPTAPTPGAPPPIQYGGGGSTSVPDPSIPIVGQTPVPPGVVSQPEALPAWQPMTLTEFNAENREGVIARAQAAGIDYNTATVNNTVANNYERYVAAATQAPAPPPPAPMTLSEYNAVNRAGVIARGNEAGDPTTAQVNATIAANYARYLASLGA